MPAYFPTNTTSDVAGKNDMNAGRFTNTTQVVALAGGATVTVDYLTAEYYPNNSGSVSTNGTVQISHTVTDMNVTVNAQKHRVNSAGTIQVSGTAGTAVTTATTNTFTNLDDPDWTTAGGALCSDRVMLRLTYVNTVAMTATSITIGTDRTGTFCLTSINHNVGNCAVLRKPAVVVYEK